MKVVLEKPGMDTSFTASTVAKELEPTLWDSIHNRLVVVNQKMQRIREISSHKRYIKMECGGGLVRNLTRGKC